MDEYVLLKDGGTVYWIPMRSRGGLSGQLDGVEWEGKL